MTADVSNYTGLITSRHATKPNFLATIAASVQPFADITAAIKALPTEFDIDQAVGAQLDAVGIRVGVSRNLSEPLIGVYFSFDTPGVGFDQGTWLGPFDPTTGLVALPDDTYRILLKARIAANQWDGSVEGAYLVYEELFEALGAQIIIFDNQDMTIVIGYVGPSPTAVVLALLTGGYLGLKPAGVGVAGYISPSVPSTPFFGFDAQNGVIAGFDTGSWGISL